jgi:hypothetical protein
VKRDAVQLLDVPAPYARFDFGPLRGPTLTANGEGSRPENTEASSAASDVATA